MDQLAQTAQAMAVLGLKAIDSGKVEEVRAYLDTIEPSGLQKQMVVGFEAAVANEELGVHQTMANLEATNKAIWEYTVTNLM